MPDKRAPVFWFPAKRYGWGWGLPVAWQGWVVLLAWSALLVAGLLGLVVLEPRRSLVHATFTLAMVGALVAICYKKGEPPRWRWGNDGK